MARRRNKEKVNLSSIPKAPLESKKDKWTSLLSNFIWAIIGLVLGIAGNELYRPDLELLKEGRLPFKLIDDKISNGERVTIHEAAISLRNQGIKKGHLDRSVVKSLGVESFPNAEVSFIDRRDIGALRTAVRTIRVRISRRYPYETPITGFAIELFDDAGNSFEVSAIVDTGSAISRVAEEERLRRRQIQKAQEESN